MWLIWSMPDSTARRTSMPRRDVAGHAHPPPVGLPGDVGDELRLERAVELDLGESGVGIAPDQRHGLLGRRGDVDADGARPLSVDDPGREQAGGRDLAPRRWRPGRR